MEISLPEMKNVIIKQENHVENTWFVKLTFTTAMSMELKTPVNLILTQYRRYFS